MMKDAGGFFMFSQIFVLTSKCVSCHYFNQENLLLKGYFNFSLSLRYKVIETDKQRICATSSFNALVLLAILLNQI